MLANHSAAALRAGMGPALTLEVTESLADLVEVRSGKFIDVRGLAGKVGPGPCQVGFQLGREAGRKGGDLRIGVFKSTRILDVWSDSRADYRPTAEESHREEWLGHWLGWWGGSLLQLHSARVRLPLPSRWSQCWMNCRLPWRAVNVKRRDGGARHVSPFDIVSPVIWAQGAGPEKRVRTDNQC